MKLGRNSALRLRRHMDTAPASAKGEPMIGAFDTLAIGPPHAEWNTAMRAAIGRNDDLAITAVENQRLIEQCGLKRCLAHLTDQRHRIPVFGQYSPILRRKGAIVRQGGPVE